MSAERLTRTSVADLEVRGDGRTLAGLAIPYNQTAEINSPIGRFTEQFRFGAFARSIAERGPSKVKLLSLHDTATMPIGRATLLREDSAGLFGEFRVANTAAGDEALELVRDGVLDSFSVGFSPVRDRWSQDRRTVDRLEARLHEVSLVPFPAYDGALISSVRSATTTRADLDPHTYGFATRADRDPAAWARRLRLS